jgi:hypothetical protein
MIYAHLILQDHNMKLQNSQNLKFLTIPVIPVIYVQHRTGEDWWREGGLSGNSPNQVAPHCHNILVSFFLQTLCNPSFTLTYKVNFYVCNTISTWHKLAKFLKKKKRFCVRNEFTWNKIYTSSEPIGVRGSVVGWGTTLQAGTSRYQIPNEVDFFNWPNPSSRTMALGSTQPVTEMYTRNILGGEGRPAHKADNLTAICEPIVYKMWEPQHLTTLWVSTARYRDTFYLT